MRTIEVIRRGRNGQDGSSGLVVSLDLSANFTATAAYRAYMFRGTANLTLSFDPAASLAAGWHCFVDADGGDVVLDPNGSETINGVSTITLTDGQSAMVYTDGASLFARYFYSEGTTSLLGFPTTADRGLYSTGADVWAEFALTSTGRALLGQGNKTNMRSYLELGGLATLNTVGTSEIDDGAITTAKLASGEQMTAANVSDAYAARALDEIGQMQLASIQYGNGAGNPYTVGSTYAGSTWGLTGTWRVMGATSVSYTYFSNEYTRWIWLLKRTA